MANKDDQPLISALIDSVKETMTKMFGASMNLTATVKKRSIVTWRGKMRIFVDEKFERDCYISVVGLYTNEDNLKKDRPFGTVILYIARQRTLSLLTSLGIKFESKEEGQEGTPDEAIVSEGCGELCKTVVKGFQTKLTSLGYPDLILSSPRNYIRSVEDNISFPSREESKVEVTFQIEGGDSIFIDFVIPVI